MDFFRNISRAIGGFFLDIPAKVRALPATFKTGLSHMAAWSLTTKAIVGVSTALVVALGVTAGVMIHEIGATDETEEGAPVSVQMADLAQVGVGIMSYVPSDFGLDEYTEEVVNEETAADSEGYVICKLSSDSLEKDLTIYIKDANSGQKIKGTKFEVKLINPKNESSLTQYTKAIKEIDDKISKESKSETAITGTPNAGADTLATEKKEAIDAYKKALMSVKGDTYTDTDSDGMIYIKTIDSGDYIACFVPVSDYEASEYTTKVNVKDKVEYKKVENISDKTVSAAAAGDAMPAEAAQVEAVLTDTVEFVNSTKTLVSGGGSQASPKTLSPAKSGTNTDSKEFAKTSKKVGGVVYTATLKGTSHFRFLTAANTSGGMILTSGNTGENNNGNDNTDGNNAGNGNTGGGDGAGDNGNSGDGNTGGGDATPTTTKASISVSATSVSLAKGGSAVTVTLGGTGVTGYTAISGSEGIAKASVSGTTLTIAPVAAGSTTVTVSASGLSEGYTTPDAVSISVTVSEAAKTDTAISLSASTLSLTVGTAGTVTASGANISGFSAASANTSVATVSVSAGTITVTPVAAGTTTVTVSGTVSDASKYNAPASVSFTVTVGGSSKIKGSLSVPQSVTLYAKEGINTIDATPTLTNATISEVVSSDANTLTAKLDSSGKVTLTALTSVTANKTVTVTYTAKCTDGTTGLTAKTSVTVVGSGTAITDGSGNALYTDEACTKAATVANYSASAKFYVKGGNEVYKYTGWQSINGNSYYYTKDGNVVTGSQVIQGVKYNFGTDGALLTNGTGIDVSKWQGNIDWSQTKTAVSFAIIRCGFRGTSGGLAVDPTFATNAKNAKANGVRIGLYFYSRATTEAQAVEEASLAVQCAQQAGGLSYPIFIDMESSEQAGLSNEQRTAVVNAFCTTVRNSGYSAGLYANKSWLTTKINTGSLSGIKIWCAQYNTTCTYAGHKDMWQYSSKGSVPGISGNVDMNISYF